LKISQLEAQLKGMTPEDLLDLIKQGYGQESNKQYVGIKAADGLD